MCLLATDLDLLHQCSSLLSKNDSVFRQNHSVLKQKYIFNIKKNNPALKYKMVFSYLFSNLLRCICLVLHLNFLWTIDGWFCACFCFHQIVKFYLSIPRLTITHALNLCFNFNTIHHFMLRWREALDTLLIFFFTPLLLELSDFSPDSLKSDLFCCCWECKNLPVLLVMESYKWGLGNLRWFDVITFLCLLRQQQYFFLLKDSKNCTQYFTVLMILSFFGLSFSPALWTAFRQRDTCLSVVQRRWSTLCGIVSHQLWCPRNESREPVVVCDLSRSSCAALSTWAAVLKLKERHLDQDFFA